MEHRTLGKTGLNVSMVGFGGIVVAHLPQGEADSAVSEAIDRGINYFDFAPTYYDAEERLGPALRGRRDEVVLACKTTQRTKEGASEELHRSLNRLETDHFDIYQFHGVGSIDELDTIMSPGGAMETFLDARERGLIRFIGITTHFTSVALEALKRFHFDTILFPVNFALWFRMNEGPEVMEAAAARGMGRMAIKSMAKGPWPGGVEKRWPKCWYEPFDDQETAELAVRFTLSRGVDVMMPPGHLELWHMAVEIAERFRPLQPDEEEYLRTLAVQSAPLFKSL